MKHLTFLKWLVYILGVLLIASTMFLVYVIYKELTEPDNINQQAQVEELRE